MPMNSKGQSIYGAMKRHYGKQKDKGTYHTTSHKGKGAKKKKSRSVGY